MSRTEPGRRPDDAPPWRVGRPPPQGPSLGSGLCCPGPSSLNRPHPPHSQAHRDFTAGRLIRDAFAVRERLGDPRVVPGFRYHSVLTCRPLRPRGVQPSHVSSLRDADTGLRRDLSGSALPMIPQIRFTRGTYFEASWFTHSLRPVRLLAPLNGSDRSPSHRGLLLPGFRRLGRPPRRWI